MKNDLRILVHRLIPSYLRQKADDNYFVEFVKLWLSFVDKEFYQEFDNMRKSLDIDLANEIVSDKETLYLSNPNPIDGYIPKIGDRVNGQVLYDGVWMDKPQGAVGIITDIYEEGINGDTAIVFDVDLRFGDFFNINRIVIRDTLGNIVFESRVSQVYDEKRDFYSSLFINQFGYNFKDILKGEIATSESKQLMVKYIKDINEKKGNELAFIRFFNSFKPKFFDDNIMVRMISNLYYYEGELLEFPNHLQIDNYVLGLEVPEYDDEYYEAGVKNEYLKMIPATFVYKLETNLDPKVFRIVLENSIHPAGFKFIYDYMISWNITFNTGSGNHTVNYHNDSKVKNLENGLTDHYGVLV